MGGKSAAEKTAQRNERTAALKECQNKNKQNGANGGGSAASGGASAQTKNPGQGKGKGKDPCTQITQTCKSAGFKFGAHKQGIGLEDDCINPIVQGVTSVPNGKLPLPAVSADVIAACKVKNPKYGQGQIGN